MAGRLASGNINTASSPSTTNVYTAAGDVTLFPACFDRSGSVPCTGQWFVNDGTADRAVSVPFPLEQNGGWENTPIMVSSGNILKLKLTFTGTCNVDYWVGGG